MSDRDAWSAHARDQLVLSHAGGKNNSLALLGVVIGPSVLVRSFCPAAGAIYRATSRVVFRRHSWLLPAFLVGYAPYWFLPLVACLAVLSGGHVIFSALLAQYIYWLLRWHFVCARQQSRLARQTLPAG